MKITIYHNPRCGKSRKACGLLDTKGHTASIRLYLKEPLSTEELEALLTKLGKKPLEIIRKKEKTFKENLAGKSLTDDQWVQAIIKFPILMERPIVEVDDKAWVVRDEAAISELLSSLT